MNKVSLLILAAGLGSRYKGQKQVDAVSSGGETLMEFALFDALKAGIRKFVIIINNQFPEDYKKRLTEIIQNQNAEIHFVIQSVNQFIPERFIEKLKKRTKPLGTGHAVYSAKDVISEPFVTMNADDFYGRRTFEIAAKMVNQNLITENTYGMIPFELQNTLSENGTVSRGLCHLKEGMLKDVEEFVGIEIINGVITGKDQKGESKKLLPDDKVSMNLWVLHPSFFKRAEKNLSEFLENPDNILSSELYLPAVINGGLRKNELKVVTELTNEKWFGMTYGEDKILVEKEIENLKAKGIYPENLWEE